MTVHFVHDAKHASTMVTDALEVFAFGGKGLGCLEKQKKKKKNYIVELLTLAM